MKRDYNECKKNLILNAELKRHMNIDLSNSLLLIGIKPFKCHYIDCNYSSVIESHLKRHIRLIHWKEKPFKCDFEDCGQLFGTKHNLKTNQNYLYCMRTK